MLYKKIQNYPENLKILKSVCVSKSIKKCNAKVIGLYLSETLNFFDQ